MDPEYFNEIRFTINPSVDWGRFVADLSLYPSSLIEFKQLVDKLGEIPEDKRRIAGLFLLSSRINQDVLKDALKFLIELKQKQPSQRETSTPE